MNKKNCVLVGKLNISLTSSLCRGNYTVRLGIALIAVCDHGTKEIRDVFWWLLFFAISNTENHNTRDQTVIQMTFYYMTLNLLAKLEKYHQSLNLTKHQPCAN
jgi:hypothetical protein